MLREAIEKIESLSKPVTHEIDGKTFSDERLHEVRPELDAPNCIDMHSLDGIVQMLTEEIDLINIPAFVQVCGHDAVKVYTALDVQSRYTRQFVYKSTATDLPSFAPGRYMNYEEAMIALRSIFADNEGTAYLLDLLSRITSESNVTSADNGVTQTVEARKGIQLAGVETVKSRVKLRPYRTFMEVEQPESEFLVRVREGGEIAFFEADGGMWRLAAREMIKAYFMERLSGLIEEGKAVVTI